VLIEVGSRHVGGDRELQEAAQQSGLEPSQRGVVLDGAVGSQPRKDIGNDVGRLGFALCEGAGESAKRCHELPRRRYAAR
jgi:hypothetical protein